MAGLATPGRDEIALLEPHQCDRQKPPARSETGNVRTRTLIGMLGLLGFVGVYAILVVALGSSRLLEVNGFVTLLFYAAAGLLWVPPAALIIRWMEKPQRQGRVAAS